MGFFPPAPAASISTQEAPSWTTPPASSKTPRISRATYSLPYLASGPEICLLKPLPTSHLLQDVLTASAATHVWGHVEGIPWVGLASAV